MRITISLTLLALLAVTAHADPDSCKALRPLRYGELSVKIQNRFSDGARWERTKNWKPIVVSVWIDRAPHLAAAIVEECGGVHVDQTYPGDVRRLTSSIQLHVTSYAALVRIAQLPAVKRVSAIDSSRKLLPPRRQPAPFLFEED